jgi:hypothetical protein
MPLSVWRDRRMSQRACSRGRGAAGATFLVPATASGGQETSNAPMVTLTVSIAGTGNGWVTGGASSGSEGAITCGKLDDPFTATCSASFTADEEATLVAQAAVGSTFAGWSTASPYSCGFSGGGGFPPGQSWCQIFLFDTPGNATVQATFNRTPPPCVAPGVKGLTLARAKIFIRDANCTVGKIGRDFSRTVRKGRVISQSPPAHWRREHGAKINLVVSKGRR